MNSLPPLEKLHAGKAIRDINGKRFVVSIISPQEEETMTRFEAEAFLSSLKNDPDIHDAVKIKEILNQPENQIIADVSYEVWTKIQQHLRTTYGCNLGVLMKPHTVIK